MFEGIELSHGATRRAQKTHFDAVKAEVDTLLDAVVRCRIALGESAEDTTAPHVETAAAASSAVALLKKLHRATSTTGKAQKAFHASISKFGKAIERGCVIGPNAGVYALGREAPLGAQATLKLALEHLLHRGCLRAAAELRRAISGSAEVGDMVNDIGRGGWALSVASAAFQEAMQVAEVLKGGSGSGDCDHASGSGGVDEGLAAARAWAAKHADFLRSPDAAHCRVPIQIMRLEFVRILSLQHRAPRVKSLPSSVSSILSRRQLIHRCHRRRYHSSHRRPLRRPRSFLIASRSPKRAAAGRSPSRAESSVALPMRTPWPSRNWLGCSCALAGAAQRVRVAT